MDQMIKRHIDIITSIKYELDEDTKKYMNDLFRELMDEEIKYVFYVWHDPEIEQYPCGITNPHYHAVTRHPTRQEYIFAETKWMKVMNDIEANTKIDINPTRTMKTSIFAEYLHFCHLISDLYAWQD